MPVTGPGVGALVKAAVAAATGSGGADNEGWALEEGLLLVLVLLADGACVRARANLQMGAHEYDIS